MGYTCACHKHAQPLACTNAAGKLTACACAAVHVKLREQENVLLQESALVQLLVYKSQIMSSLQESALFFVCAVLVVS
eukprot:1159783-Pelagomonas_calceolata.AAC.17